MNEWISIKDRLPENDNPVLIILNTKDQQSLVACFVKQLSGFSGEFKNTWFVFAPPRFPKPWMFSEEYTKAFIPFPRNKLVFERVKTPGFNDRKWASIDLILAHLRSLNRGGFHAAQMRIYFLGMVLDLKKKK